MTNYTIGSQVEVPGHGIGFVEAVWKVGTDRTDVVFYFPSDGTRLTMSFYNGGYEDGVHPD